MNKLAPLLVTIPAFVINVYIGAHVEDFVSGATNFVVGGFALGWGAALSAASFRR